MPTDTDYTELVLKSSAALRNPILRTIALVAPTITAAESYVRNLGWGNGVAESVRAAARLANRIRESLSEQPAGTRFSLWRQRYTEHTEASEPLSSRLCIWDDEPSWGSMFVSRGIRMGRENSTYANDHPTLPFLLREYRLPFDQHYMTSLGAESGVSYDECLGYDGSLEGGDLLSLAEVTEEWSPDRAMCFTQSAEVEGLRLNVTYPEGQMPVASWSGEGFKTDSQWVAIPSPGGFPRFAKALILRKEGQVDVNQWFERIVVFRYIDRPARANSQLGYVYYVREYEVSRFLAVRLQLRFLIEKNGDLVRDNEERRPLIVVRDDGRRQPVSWVDEDLDLAAQGPYYQYVYDTLGLIKAGQLNGGLRLSQVCGKHVLTDPPASLVDLFGRSNTL